MLHNLAKKLAQLFIKAGVVSPEDEDIYIYGWEMILATGAGFLTMFVLSFFIGDVLGTVAFIFSLFFLRIYSGGYHALTFLGCYIVTTSCYLLTAFIVKLIPADLIIIITLILIILSLLIIYVRAPQEHPSRPMQEGELETFRRKTRLIAIIETALALIALFLFPSLANCALWISLAMSITAILLIVPSRKPQ